MTGKSVTRRGFVAGGALAAGLLGLAGCSAAGGTDGATKGSGYKETDSGNGYTIVDNGDGKQLSYSPDSGLKLIEKDGYAFKDFEARASSSPTRTGASPPRSAPTTWPAASQSSRLRASCASPRTCSRSRTTTP